MNNTQSTPELNIGDKIGFVILASGIDDADKTIFFSVCKITEKDGERAYFYEFPDGSISSSAIRQSDLRGHALQIEPQIARNMICLSERRDEFREALERGKDNSFDVFADWDRDAFVVVNLGNKNEYRVKLESSKNLLFAECSCPDFKFRNRDKKRVCKHIAEVLTNALFSAKI